MPSLESVAVPFVDSAAVKQAEANEEALRSTGRFATQGLLAPMDTAPTELYTRMEEDVTSAQKCTDRNLCLVLWRPINEDQAMAYGTYGNLDSAGGQFTTVVDVATGEATWTVEHALPGPAEEGVGGETCSQATPSALVCLISGEDEYTLRTRSLKDGQQIAEATFGSDSVASILGSMPLAQDMSRHGDSVYMMAILGEHGDPSGAGTLHSAKIAADGSIEWLTEFPAKIAEWLYADVHVIGEQVFVTHVTTRDGEPFALNEKTGEAVPITSENAAAWTKIVEAAQPAVDDGSVSEYWFRIDDETGTLEARPAGSDSTESPAWSSPQELTALCDGSVVLLSEPFDQGSRGMTVVSATDGARQWDTWVHEDDAISCDGSHVIVADGVQLRALDAETGTQAWAIPAPWDSVMRILPLNPFGPSKRFAVLGGQDDPDEFADIYTYTVFEAP